MASPHGLIGQKVSARFENSHLFREGRNPFKHCAQPRFFHKDSSNRKIVSNLP
jgi:hypothetical protein